MDQSNVIDSIPCEFCDLLIPLDRYEEHIEIHTDERDAYANIFENLPFFTNSNVTQIEIFRPLDIFSSNLILHAHTRFPSPRTSSDEDEHEDEPEDEPEPEPEPQPEPEPEPENTVIRRPSTRRRIVQNNVNQSRRRRRLTFEHYDPISPVNLRRLLAVDMSPNLVVRSSESSYEFYTRLGETIGNVEVGIDDMNEVSRDIDQKNVKKEDIRCPICLEQFHEQQPLLILICSHVFCKTCINQWLKAHKTCPLCKIDLEDAREISCATPETKKN